MDDVPSSLPPTPMPPRDLTIQAALDESHLRLLEIGFYISGGLTIFRFFWFLLVMSFFAIAGLSGAVAAAQHHQNSGDAFPPLLIMGFFAIFFGIFLFFNLIFAGMEIYAGRCLKNRKNPTMIYIVAALYCLSIPWGTALGICTFTVLGRPSVKQLFS